MPDPTAPAALIARVTAVVGLGAGDLARVLGISVPMLARLREGERSRLANPGAAARLHLLVRLADRLESGAADPRDTPLTLAQIAAATGSGSVRPPDATALAGSRPLTRRSLGAARDRVAPHVRPSPALRWPLLEERTGTPTWVKHENHNPTGAFKVRGGLNFVARLLAEAPERPAGLVTASRGNHSQSIAFAGRAHDLPVTIVVPEGNSPDKNAATRALGAELVVHGRDFQAALEHAGELAGERGLVSVPPWHPWLVEGVATYAAELHDAVPGLDVVYVPVGMGSGICANIWVRDLLGLSTEVVGVVSERAPAYALSFEAGEVVTTTEADTFVDGVACRTPHPEAVRVIAGGAARIVRVSEEQAGEAMALMYRATHNLAEPAGSLGLAGLLADDLRADGARCAVVHCGGNADFDVLARVMAR